MLKDFKYKFVPAEPPICVPDSLHPLLSQIWCSPPAVQLTLAASSGQMEDVLVRPDFLRFGREWR